MKKIIGVLVVILCGLVLFAGFNWKKLEASKKKQGVSEGIENILGFKKHINYFDNAYEEVKSDLSKNNINAALNVFYKANNKEEKKYSDYGKSEVEKIKVNISNWYLENNKPEEAKEFVNKYGLEKMKTGFLYDMFFDTVAFVPNRNDYGNFQEKYLNYERNIASIENAKILIKNANANIAKENYLNAYDMLRKASIYATDPSQSFLKESKNFRQDEYLQKEIKKEEEVCVNKLMPEYKKEALTYANAGMFKKSNYVVSSLVDILVSERNTGEISLENSIKSIKEKTKVSFSDAINILEKSDESIGGNVVFSNVLDNYVVYSHPNGEVNFVVSEQNGVLNGSEGYLFNIQNTSAFKGKFDECNKEYYAFVNKDTGNVSYYTGKINFKENFNKVLFGTDTNPSGKNYFTVQLARGVLINYLRNKNEITFPEYNNIENIFGNSFKELGRKPYQELEFKGISYVVSINNIYKVENGKLEKLESTAIRV